MARPVGPGERGLKWVRRQPVVAGLTAAVALILLAGALVAWGLAAWALGEKGRADGQAQLAMANARETGEEKDRADASARDARAKEKEARAAKLKADTSAAHALAREKDAREARHALMPAPGDAGAEETSRPPAGGCRAAAVRRQAGPGPTRVAGQ